MLSGDLARMLVSQFSANWDRFKQFTLKADMSDAGQSSALGRFGIDLAQQYVPF